ncbi:MAG: beta-hydroxyacyl-ACP dehydratase [Gemmataceae bacterium]|nr:beta-hydroxyacyl-ACP dehydratase [Gemmataceae bacterium]
MPPQAHFDLAKLEPDRILANREAIRAILPQRFEMEQLDAVVHVDASAGIIVGYKDVRHDEFWVRGHMPGYPLLPGVLMCEAAAQLVSYYAITQHIMGGDFLGFGGLENVRFRAPVHPGQRLHLVGKVVRLHRRQCTFNVQAFVGSTMVFEGDIIGVPLQRKAEV